MCGNRHSVGVMQFPWHVLYGNVYICVHIQMQLLGLDTHPVAVLTILVGMLTYLALYICTHIMTYMNVCCGCMMWGLEPPWLDFSCRSPMGSEPGLS